MPGRPNAAMFQTMIEKHGSEENAREWFRTIGQIGGRNNNGKGGFGQGEAGRERARASGALGGKLSRRGPSTTAKQTTIDKRKYLKSPYCTFCNKRNHKALDCDVRLDMIAKNKRILEKHGQARPW